MLISDLQHPALTPGVRNFWTEAEFQFREAYLCKLVNYIWGFFLEL